MNVKKSLVVLALIASLACVETTVVVTATPWPEPRATNTPVFVATAAPLPVSTPAPPAPQPSYCDPSYPDVCIPPSPPDLDCGDIPHWRFRVLPPDPHRFDGDGDGIGCEAG